MSLDFQDVRRIAKLARVAVGEQDVHMYQHRINGVLALVAQMQAVDTQGVAPMAHALDVVQSLRADVVTEVDLHEKFQAIAPQVAGGLYLVPQVIEYDN